MRFRYRRALGWEHIEVIRAANALKPREADLRWAKFIRGKLVSWEATGPKDDILDLTEQNVFQLDPRLQEGLIGIIAGLRASDTDPEAEAEGLPETLVSLQEDLKNSPPA